jgi:hypothetical protein
MKMRRFIVTPHPCSAAQVPPKRRPRAILVERERQRRSLKSGHSTSQANSRTRTLQAEVRQGCRRWYGYQVDMVRAASSSHR